jgi:diaminopimelate epimerase
LRKQIFMESIPFVKYHGAGNDFIMIDDRSGSLDQKLSEAWIAKACHRRFGIGADGLILLQQGTDGADFFMKYYNSDGRTSSFCGNGGRCIVAFGAALGVHSGSCRFLGTDGWHEGRVFDNGLVTISMKDVEEVVRIDDHSLTLNTGSPHFINFRQSVADLDVFSEGRAVRYSPRFNANGINVNFVERISDGEIIIRTYERGVEDETFACGTGVVAAAIASAYNSGVETSSWLVHAKGGDLHVDFRRAGEQSFQDVLLTGPAVSIFKGEIPI